MSRLQSLEQSGDEGVRGWASGATVDASVSPGLSEVGSTGDPPEATQRRMGEPGRIQGGLTGPAPVGPQAETTGGDGAARWLPILSLVADCPPMHQHTQFLLVIAAESESIAHLPRSPQRATDQHAEHTTASPVSEFRSASGMLNEPVTGEPRPMQVNDTSRCLIEAGVHPRDFRWPLAIPRVIFG